MLRSSQSKVRRNVFNAHAGTKTYQHLNIQKSLESPFEDMAVITFKTMGLPGIGLRNSSNSIQFYPVKYTSFVVAQASLRRL